MQGAGLRCAAFQLLLFAALRTLVDRLGVTTFNVGVYNIPAGAGADGDASGTVDRPAPLLARCCFFFFGDMPVACREVCTACSSSRAPRGWCPVLRHPVCCCRAGWSPEGGPAAARATSGAWRSLGMRP